MNSTCDRNSDSLNEEPLIEFLQHDLVHSNKSDAYDRICSICNYAFLSKKQFLDHLKFHDIQIEEYHSLYNELNDDEEELKQYQQKQNGVLTTYVIRPFKCCLCELVFDRMSQLDNHKRSVHQQERSQICQICGKGFFRPTDLKTHLNIHLGTNRSICEICGKKFNHVSNLIRHIRTHSGVKPYPCNICGKRFTQINTLARHKAIHKRGAESMDCFFCDKQYKTKNGLTEHMKKLHGFMRSSENYEKIIRRQHYCKICGESFQFVELLRAHENTHQNLEMFECRSCNQKFQKPEEIKEHRCEKPKLFDGDQIKFEKVLSINELNNFSNCEGDYKLCQTESIYPNKISENEQTKETIIYVKAEERANMNTEQLVDGANHFLHEHLMELTRENSPSIESMNPGDCENEMVSEAINNCWKEIEIPDVGESVITEETSVTSKHNAQNVVYIQALAKDGLIVLNDNRNLLGDITLEHFLEKPLNSKHDSSTIKNLVLNNEFQNLQSVKMSKNEYVENPTSNLIQNETLSKKLSEIKLNSNKPLDCVLYDKTNQNDREQNSKQEPDVSSPLKIIRDLKTHNSRHYFNEEISDNMKCKDKTSTENMNTLLTQNIFEELFKTHMDNVNAVIAKSSENEEPLLKLVHTENGEQFYELLITNCSEKSVTSCESDKISVATFEENLKTTQNESTPESLLKLIKLDNGQRILELTNSNCLYETDIADIIENRMEVEGSEKWSFIEKGAHAISESAQYNENRDRNLVHNKSEKILYLAQNNKDHLIDYFEIETLDLQEQNNLNSLSDEVMQDVPAQTHFDHSKILNENKNFENNSSLTGNETCEELLGLIQSDSTEKNKSESKKTKKDDGPMVRLVQNEDGAQFFELIRGDLEFDETQDVELVQISDANQEQNVQLKNNTKQLDNSCIELNHTINDMDEKTKADSDALRKKKLRNNVKKYICDVCKKSFSKGYNYRQHIGTHFADQQKFECKECGISFAWKSTLNKHVASHRAGGQQKFVCEICPKVYTTLSQVNEHVKRDHLKERNHKCTHCAKTFFKKFDLKIHIRTHTKERPYECRVCYKSFHHQSHIIRHERIHSGERPYACNICEKTFTQLGSLKNHRQRHKALRIDILDYQMDEDDPLPQKK